MFLEGLFLSVCLLLVIWRLPKFKFIKNSGLSVGQTRFLFCFKLCISLLFAVYFDQFLTSNDYLQYNQEGLLQYNLLRSNPALFFTDFNEDISTYGFGGLFASGNSFWAYLRFNLLYKFIAVLNLVTHGNFYFNTAIFSTGLFFCHVAFYRVFSELYKGYKLPMIIVCFGLPSLMLYTSCIHKDGFVFCALGIIAYCFQKFLRPGYTLKFHHLLAFLLGIVTIFLFRNYVLIALLPAMVIAMISKNVTSPHWVVIGSYAAFLAIFFLSSFSKSSLNLPNAVVQRKADFAALQGGETNLVMNELMPTIGSFVQNLPQAINHSLFRPYLWEFFKPTVVLTALELLTYQSLVMCWFVLRKRRQGPLSVFNIMGLSFFFNMMLIIGYTIPNVGAIVRYRSIFWIFLIAPLVGNIDWKRMLPLFARHRQLQT